MGIRQRIDDARLASGIRRGNPNAQAAFVDRFAPRLLANARRNCRTEADAEDLAQEALLASVAAMENWRGEASLNTFVFRIALNLAARRLRDAPPEPTPLESVVLAAPASDPADHVARRESRACVHRALACLSPEHREVVELHELDGLTYAECAALIGVPVGTVKSRLFHALRKLRPLLAEALEETP